MSTTVSAAVPPRPPLQGQRPGQTVTVTKLTGEGPCAEDYGHGDYQERQRLCPKVAPWATLWEITVRGYELSIRKGTVKTFWLSEACAWVPAALPDWGSTGHSFLMGNG